VAIIAAADLKTWLGISDTTDDTTIATAVAAANSAVPIHCGRTFDKTATNAASARVYYADGTCRVNIDDFWETSALVVKTDDGDDGTYEQTWTLGTDFQVEPLNGLDGPLAVPYYRLRAVGTLRFPTSNLRPGVQITAAWGWTAVPGDVTEATLIKASRLFKRKDTPEGVLGGFADIGAVRISNREDPDVVALLRPYVRTDRLALVG
jgi:hypothetical protein